MNNRLILRALGIMLCCLAVAMLPSLALSTVDASDDTLAFLLSIFITAIVGFALVLIKPGTMQVGYKEGFLVAALGWLLLSTFGALPFYISGILTHPVDAFFESASGFTTTGASVIANIEGLSRGILFWRSLIHWLGGMGIIVLTLALMPSINVAGFRMFKAEVPGPTKSKVLPKVAQTARELYKVYLLFSLGEFILLKVAGMSWFDAMIHTLGTMGTGGSSSRNASIGYFDSLSIELIIVFFMILCGINFSLHYSVMNGNRLAYFKDTETKVYLGIIAVAVMLVSINLVNDLDYGIDKAARLALFQVTSVITSTGFTTADFYQWPDFSRFLLVVLMFVGACSGSTGAGIKVIRLLIVLRALSNQMSRLIHPQAVIPVRLGNSVIPQEVVQTVQNFFALFILCIGIAVAALLALGIDLSTAFMAVITTISCLGAVSPATMFADMPQVAKLILTFCMFIGRLELFTILVVLNLKFWK